ncbi:hypothetical protein BCR36DRAFT_374363 [Piromyces finnis]|uniref:Uncharacterized protein n=1 Tax=Piromyces finnis TaxID=1754191 RepID=A0A1Y1UZ48_9FUNG|nr:hypothetical protein BCR36DRAFT_374363 [Piromyces finnis]|eukprot:ORX42634.1 hypothetical protein BCR36DRAFT_374363 [Piromyces finnis]
MMHSFTLILLFIPLIYSLNVTIDNVPDNFVLKYDKTRKRESFISELYCRKKDCIGIKYNEELNTFIEFPDENNNLKYYITTFFIYDDKSKKFITSNDGYFPYNDNSTYISLKCNNDSDCLYNKCIENHCRISIINCNNLTKDKYTIEYSNNNINDYLSNFLLINTLKKICNEKIFKYNFDLKDTTKTKFYISINIPSYTLKDIYNKIIKLELPNTCQYTETYHYNQVLIAEDKNKNIKDSDNFIIIKCCHDSIRITGNKITFYERDTFNNIICKLLPCLNYSSNQILIKFKPSIVSFTYPININYQLLDLMLYENALYPYIYTDENEDIIKSKEKLVYTINIFNQSLNMKLYNKYKQFTEIIRFQELECNKDKVLPVIADKEKCIKNNIPSPENLGYKIILSTNKNSTDNNFVFHNKKLLFDSESELNLVPKCVKVIRKYKEKETSVYFNITYKLDKHCKGRFPSNLFISYGYELQGLYRQYFDIPEINNKFMICSNCNKYINIPSQ